MAVAATIFTCSCQRHSRGLCNLDSDGRRAILHCLEDRAKGASAKPPKRAVISVTDLTCGMQQCQAACMTNGGQAQQCSCRTESLKALPSECPALNNTRGRNGCQPRCPPCELPRWRQGMRQRHCSTTCCAASAAGLRCRPAQAAACHACANTAVNGYCPTLQCRMQHDSLAITANCPPSHQTSVQCCPTYACLHPLETRSGGEELLRSDADM